MTLALDEVLRMRCLPHSIGDLVRRDAHAKTAGRTSGNVRQLGLRPQWHDGDDADLVLAPFQIQSLRQT